MINTAAAAKKMATEKRFKILSLLALNMGIWEKQMAELAEKLDNDHPQALQALSFFEDAMLKACEEEAVN